MKYILLENHPNDSRVKIQTDGICQTLNGRMGTGGGNVPLVIEITYETDNDRERSRGGTIGFSDEVTGTLRSQMGGHPPLVLIDEDEDTD